MRYWRLLAVVIVWALLPTTHAWSAGRPRVSARDYFPLTKGNSWTYQGTVREAYEEGKPVACTVEVTRTIADVWKLGDGAYLAPLDATVRIVGACPDAKVADEIRHAFQPADLLLYFVDGPKVYEVWSDVATRRTGHKDMHAVTLAELRAYAKELVPDFVFPLRVGLRYNEGQEPVREDYFYQWVVSRGKPVRIGQQLHREVYTLRYRSLPDEQEVDFIPGVGIAREKSVHHGPTDEWELRLVRYHLLTPPQPSPSR